MQEEWVAAHIYCYPPWEVVLANQVLPLKNKILKNSLASQYFFIRYWELGPHLRIRFKTEKPDIIKRLIEEHIIFTSSPIEDRNRPDQWLPNNSIQYFPYEPEIDRYGGKHCMELSEEKFQLCSEIVLDLIDEKKEWNYNTALGIALRMHFGMTYAIGMSFKDMLDFFHFIFLQWLPAAYNPERKELPEKEIIKKEKEAVKLFEEAYEKQKVIADLLEMQWDELTEGKEKGWMSKWVNHLQSTDQQLRLLQDKKLLKSPYEPHHITGAASVADKERWSIYASHVHMTNNRLGIANKDEAFIAFLLIKTLRKLSENKK